MSTNSHLNGLLWRYRELAACRAEIERAFEIVRDCFRSGGKLLMYGNGGSAADAGHWGGELLKGFLCTRSLEPADRAGLPADFGFKHQGALPAIPVTSFISAGTAFADDVDPQLGFAQLLWALSKPGDTLVGISTSGNARNVCAAMETAKARGLLRIGPSGRNGGLLNSLCDLCIKVPADETYRVQESHLPVYHCPV